MARSEFGQTGLLSGSNIDTFRQGPGVIGWTDCGVIPFVSGVTLNPANVSNGTVEVAVQFPLLARTVEVRNSLSGTNVPIRVHCKPVNNQTNEVGSLQVITGTHYIPLNAYNETHLFKVPLKSIFISLATTAATGSALVYAELTQWPTSSAPFLSGSGLTA